MHCGTCGLWVNCYSSENTLTVMIYRFMTFDEPVWLCVCEAQLNVMKQLTKPNSLASASRNIFYKKIPWLSWKHMVCFWKQSYIQFWNMHWGTAEVSKHFLRRFRRPHWKIYCYWGPHILHLSTSVHLLFKIWINDNIIINLCCLISH